MQNYSRLLILNNDKACTLDIQTGNDSLVPKVFLKGPAQAMGLRREFHSKNIWRTLINKTWSSLPRPRNKASLWSYGAGPQQQGEISKHTIGAVATLMLSSTEEMRQSKQNFSLSYNKPFSGKKKERNNVESSGWVNESAFLYLLIQLFSAKLCVKEPLTREGLRR